VERHGKAVEPFLGAPDVAEGVKGFVAKQEVKEQGRTAEGKGAEAKAKTIEANGSSGEHVKDAKTTKRKESKAKNGTGNRTETIAEPSASAPLSEEMQAAATLPGDPIPPSEPVLETRASSQTATTSTLETFPPSSPKPTDSKPQNPDSSAIPTLETVLQMPSPPSPEAENDGKTPHLQTPPYVHHFDTYTLVQQVERGGFTTKQSVTAMKAVRSLLAHNLDVAKQGLVSKSDVENVSFTVAPLDFYLEVPNHLRGLVPRVLGSKGERD